MSTNAYTAMLHQMILMARDPLFITIDEESGSFTPEERAAIRVAAACPVRCIEAGRGFGFGQKTIASLPV